MRQIDKGPEPKALARWVSRHRGTGYRDLPDALRIGLRATLIHEQHGLCAYCGDAIDPDNRSSHIDHVEPRAAAPQRQLDYANMVASCNGGAQREHCGEAHKNRPLPDGPLSPGCEERFQYGSDGSISGGTTEAQATIALLSLDCTRLRRLRDNAYWGLLGHAPDSVCIIPPDEVDLLLELVESRDANNRLRRFAPALAGMLRHLIDERRPGTDCGGSR